MDHEPTNPSLENQSKLLSDLLPDGVVAFGDVQCVKINGLSSDSRRIEPGFLFAAFKGSTVDGAQFLNSAIERGANVVLVEDDENLDLRDRAIVLRARNPRRAFAQLAAAFYGRQPATIAAVTGTAGKTSVAAFLRQIWLSLGHQAASIGTVGVVSPNGQTYGSLTTPDPVALHETIEHLAEQGVTHLVLEASSHGLHQCRLDGVGFTLGAFTNLGRDHMDYHATVEDYFDAKMRLFETLMPEGAPVVVDLDSAYGPDACERAYETGCGVFTVGRDGAAIRLIENKRAGFKQKLTLEFSDREREVLLPLVGDFQVSNALVAAGMALASGGDPDAICSALETLQGEAGRMEYVGTAKSGALIFVDYAHKVEALENVLDALKPYADHHLTVVFGAGGDRDPGKRALMGKAAHERADSIIITDDNPRSEDPQRIRSMIMEAAPQAVEIADRKAAIHHAIHTSHAGDVVVIAGKGHETGQIVGDEVFPFSDHEVVAEALIGENL